MSGHNPHGGRLGQPNASFNHLQVPFIPRQPQLAHVHMNDAILRSSPLNWHQADAAFLNYMSTQHKTPLELNPLAFVRPPAANSMNSFGTVDLSFPSHHRHNLTPSPHNTTNNTTALNSGTPPTTLEPFPPQFTSKSMLNSSTALPSPNSLREVMSNIVNGDKNGTNCETSVPANLTTGLFVAHQLNDPTKNTAWNPTAAHNEPIELIKEKILKNFQELIERNATSDPTSSLLNHTPAASTFTGLLPNSTINNNTSAQRLGELPASPNHNNANTSTNSHNTSRDSQATTSNDESVDSSVGKKRRRRKPNKTCRLSNNGIGDDDDALEKIVVSNNNKQLEATTSTAELPPVVSDETRLVDTATTASKKLNDASAIVAKDVTSSSTVCQNPSSESDNRMVEPPLQPLEPIEQSVSAVENGSASRDDGFCSPVTTRTRRSVSRITSPNELSQDNNSSNNSISNNSSNQRRPGKRKTEPDADCETIDKIAAMIASSSPEFNPKNGRSTPNVPTSDPLLPAAELENGNSKVISTTTTVQQPVVDQKDRRFEDVEIKLEEMFAGIEDDVNQTKVKCTKLEVCKEVRVAIESLGSLGTFVPKTETKKKTKAKVQKKALNSSSTSDETDHKAKKPVKRLPKSKTKRGKGKKAVANNKPIKANSAATDNKKTKIKEETVDTTSKFRGPFIHVKIDGSSNVVNAPITEEIAENKSKIKKTLANPNQNDRSKIRGLHVSTLSMKYDASTTDKSWMCVFCKLGPHKFGLGDLFGPYILSTIGEDFELSQVDPAEDVFKSRKTKANMIQQRTLPPVAVGVVATTGNKRKRKATEPIPSTSSNTSITSSSSCTSDTVVDIFHGMTKTTDTSYEVWVHGDCVVWSSGVHLIGQRIVGLDAAVWSSTRHRCNKCQQYGAMLCCFKRGCGDVAHVSCARKANWNLCDEDFKVLCDKHCENVVDKVDVTTTTTVKQT